MMNSLALKSKRLLSGLFVVAFAHNCQLAEGRMQSPNDDPVVLAIKRLCSPGDQERNTAKDEIVRLGTKAIPSLLSVLGELTDYSRMSALKPEGRRTANPGILSTLKDHKCLTDPRLNWEVSADVCDLLGRLQAVEAVPLLLRIMDERDVINKMTAMTFEMKALVSIGVRGVPQIVEFFESAESRAESIGFGAPEPDMEEQIRYKQGRAATARARAATILATIGDAQALPVLEHSLRLSNPAAWRPDLPYIRKAVTEIKRKNRIP